MLTILLALPGLLPPFPQAERAHWPQWRGALGDGLSHGVGWSSAGKTLWTAEVGLGYSAPAVTAGRVLAYGFDVERSLDVLRCLEEQSGRELWRAEAPGELRANQHEGGTLSSPAVSEGRVFVLSSSGLVSCHALADGALLWRADLVERHGVEPDYYGFAGSPLVLAGRLYLAAGRAFALEPASGATLWASEPLGAQYASPAACTLDGAERLVLFSQNALHLLDRADGKELASFPWHDSDRLVNAATPVLVGNRVFVSSAYEHGCALVEFTPDGARALFRNKAMRNKMAGCVLLDGHLYGFDESVLKCLDLEGNERWRVRGLGSGALSGGDGKLAVLSSGGELVLARATPAAFEELERVSLFEEGVCWTPPVIANGRIWCRNNRGTLVCRDHREEGGAVLAPALGGAVGARSEAELPEGVLPEAALLVAQHLAAIGGPEALARHPHLRLTGTYEQRSVGFVPAPFEIHSSAPDKRRVRIQLPPPLDERFAHEGVPGHIARVHDGSESFELNRYRGDKLLTPAEAREEAVAARDPIPASATLTTDSRVLFDERPCYRVTSTSPDQRRTLYFEQSTGLLAGREAEDEAMVCYRDYRAFDDLSLPTSIRVFRPDGGIEEHFLVEQVSFEEPPPDTFTRSEKIQELISERDGG